ncbi:hypothetical protein, partial [Pseudomonas syringae]|uniref:hypothetical protein n=1 Tax=Pseudomonas syringae TaxID=317 RepID=UPI0019553222
MKELCQFVSFCIWRGTFFFSCKLQAASCKLQAASCKLQAASRKCRAARQKVLVGGAERQEAARW